MMSVYTQPWIFVNLWVSNASRCGGRRGLWEGLVNGLQREESVLSSSHHHAGWDP